jgi:DNA-binding MarR family transcriptional regulator
MLRRGQAGYREGSVKGCLQCQLFIYHNNCVKRTSVNGTAVGLPEFRRHLRLLEREIVQQLEADTSCCGVTLGQCHALLGLADGELSLTGLATVLDLDASTVSRTVDSLVRAGLVQRAEDAVDRRILRITLTKAGREKIATIDATCNGYYEELLGGMCDRDRRCVLRAVALLAERMRTLRRSASCHRTENRDGAR